MADTAPKPFVFVLMPFEPSFDDVYKLGIKPACQDAGAYCERVDEQIFQKETILSRIYNQIAKGDLIVADMTGRNPNVFYEVGYAHALGKDVILATQNSEDIPFDLKHYSHIVYGSKISNLKEELTKKVRWFVEHPQTSISVADKHLELFLGGVSLSGSPELPWPENGNFKIDVFNPTSKTWPGDSVRIGVIVERKYGTTTDFEARISLPDGRWLLVLDTLNVLFPSDWTSLYLDLMHRDEPRGVDRDTFVFRVLSEPGAIDYPVTFLRKK